MRQIQTQVKRAPKKKDKCSLCPYKDILVKTLPEFMTLYRQTYGILKTNAILGQDRRGVS